MIFLLEQFYINFICISVTINETINETYFGILEELIQKENNTIHTVAQYGMLLGTKKHMELKNFNS